MRSLVLTYPMKKLSKSFYQKDVLEVAPNLLGKILVRRFDDGSEFKEIITEVEAYCGEHDLACHANKGRTPRTEVMYGEGGLVYVYLIYGMHWLLNVVTGKKDEPQAVLICGLDSVRGPGSIGNALGLDKSFYGENLVTSKRIWLERGNFGEMKFESLPRIGVDYAGEWAKKPWRFVLKELK